MRKKPSESVIKFKAHEEIFNLLIRDPLLRFKYPKLLFLILSILLAYFLLQNAQFAGVVSHLGQLSYFGCLIAGLFFAFGFTAPISASFFLISNPGNIFLAAIFGGIGTVIGNLIIFRLIKFSFKGEFDLLKKEKLLIYLNDFAKKTLGSKIMNYLLFAFAGILIASPLPDEAGVTLIAGLSEINEKKLMLLVFPLSTLGILVLLLI